VYWHYQLWFLRGEMKIFQSVIYWLFVFCLPVVLITSTLCCEVNKLRLYEYGFDKYEISDATGVDKVELTKVAQHLIDYFNLRADEAQITVIKGGQEFDLFNERELVHLKDVRDLIQLDYLVKGGSLLLMITCVLLLFLICRVGWRIIVKGLLWGSIVTLCLVVGLAFWALFGFERFFLLFHVVSFSNEYWMLNPATDYLIKLFPEGFFYDAAMFGFGTVMLEALLLAGVAFVILKVVDSDQCRNSSAN
jgi:integral membrane protein (TIGR01906 family)